MAKAPYYESRFIRANDPDTARAVWLRETLLLPTVGEPVADVWVMVFDPSGHRAVKQQFTIAEAAFGYDDWTARIASTALDDTAACGALTDARWDLAITASGQEPVRVLSDRAYQSRFPTAKTTVRDPLARFDGRLEISGRGVDIGSWTGSVNHNWGTRHTPAYAYGQVCGFDNAPDATLEIVTARAALGPVLLPGVTLFVFRHEGQQFAVRSIRGSLQSHGRYAPFRWTFGARVGEQMIEGEITTVPSDVIGLTYSDTHGGVKYCYNSAIANCRIQVAGKAFERSELVSRRAMFEILTDDRLDSVPLLA
ncbi:DUF4175 domain-containing protein [Mycolicibacterium austroafricanum]|uniref:Uncharacterized protein n=1 Tax=Mycolicibacterium austroafricanum TaxID=39687 RepID=A0ABT8HP80_MYCAO|nr:hypothetical protein [Mycolicibacterium austroafricanum]MDN4522568.1 hypothetical protein [Mycolicibacterium austroafricanum]QRZ10071.1 hypothetical protein JN090_22370 [Mycolicibacterium austroafricanum]QZT71507.1 DUF4175 domain-containing protein [Mycolicibacterium austroafricanum]